MIYKNIQSKLKTIEGTKKLLEEYGPSFSMIEEYSAQLHNAVLDTPKELDKVISELGSIYVSLTVVFNLSEGYKMLKEEEFRENKKNKILGVNSNEVHYYREIKNIFKSYKDGCDRLISICQTKLKQIERERILG